MAAENTKTMILEGSWRSRPCSTKREFRAISRDVRFTKELWEDDKIIQNLKPIFHRKWGSRWVPNANEIYTKNMKCTWPMPVFCVGTQSNLYSTDWRRGLASGKTQILALGNAKIYQHVGISNAKFWRRGHCPTPTPDARYFASQWNIGFSFHTRNLHPLTFVVFYFCGFHEFMIVQ